MPPAEEDNAEEGDPELIGSSSGTTGTGSEASLGERIASNSIILTVRDDLAARWFPEQRNATADEARS